MLVLDLQMPDVSGPDVLEWIAVQGVDNQTMIVTAFPESDLMDRAMQHGHFTVLKKPFDPESLKKAVKGLLQGVIQLEAV